MTRRIGSIPEETKKNILAAATEEFSAHEFANASLRHICAKADVTTGALYAYFKDKNDLFEHVISPVTSRILSLLNSHYETELATTTENNLSEEDEDIQSTMQILNVYYANKTLCQIVLQNREHPAVCSFFDKLTQYMDRQTQLLLLQMFGSTPKKKTRIWDAGTIHWFSHVQMDSVLYIISHDLEPAQAEVQLKKMIGFMRAGFIALCQAETTETERTNPKTAGAEKMNSKITEPEKTKAKATEPKKADFSKKYI